MPSLLATINQTTNIMKYPTELEPLIHGENVFAIKMWYGDESIRTSIDNALCHNLTRKQRSFIEHIEKTGKPFYGLDVYLVKKGNKYLYRGEGWTEDKDKAYIYAKEWAERIAKDYGATAEFYETR